MGSDGILWLWNRRKVSHFFHKLNVLVKKHNRPYRPNRAKVARKWSKCGSNAYNYDGWTGNCIVLQKPLTAAKAAIPARAAITARAARAARAATNARAARAAKAAITATAVKAAKAAIAAILGINERPERE